MPTINPKNLRMLKLINRTHLKVQKMTKWSNKWWKILRLLTLMMRLKKQLRQLNKNLKNKKKKKVKNRYKSFSIHMLSQTNRKLNLICWESILTIFREYRKKWEILKKLTSEKIYKLTRFKKQQRSLNNPYIKQIYILILILSEKKYPF